MATSFSADFKLMVTGSYLASTSGFPNDVTRQPLSFSFEDALTNGTGSGQADQLWIDQRTLAATTENLDLAGGITNAFGTALTIVNLKTIIVENTHATGTVIIGNGTAGIVAFFGAATHTLKTGPGGITLLHSPILGWAITATTADILKVDSGADAIVYNIALIGTSA